MIIKKRIGIFIIAASKQISDVLMQIIEKEEQFSFEGISYDLNSAVQTIKKKPVNILIIDSGINEINFDLTLKKISEECPTPIIFLLSSNKIINSGRTEIPYDTVLKPVLGENILGFLQELQVKIKILSTKKVDKTPLINHNLDTPNKSNKIIAIGASTGGVEALAHVLYQLPENIPGIVIVQHMPPKFSKLFADRLNTNCKILVKEARDGDEVKQGVALIAAGDYHLKVLKSGDRYIVKSYMGEKVSGHCPSVDVLFDSVADAAGPNAIGVILTGMGSDGARGLLSMRERGAITLGQDRSSCVVYGMPMEAFNLGAVMKQISLNNVAKELISLTK